MAAIEVQKLPTLGWEIPGDLNVELGEGTVWDKARPWWSINAIQSLLSNSHFLQGN